MMTHLTMTLDDSNRMIMELAPLVVLMVMTAAMAASCL